VYLFFKEKNLKTKLLCLILLFAFISCGKEDEKTGGGGGGIGVPRTRPVVVAATPAFLKTSGFVDNNFDIFLNSISCPTQANPPSNIQQAFKGAFFCQSPTELAGVMNVIDMLINEINRVTGNNPDAPCLQPDFVAITENLDIFGQGSEEYKLHCKKTGPEGTFALGIIRKNAEIIGFHILSDTTMVRSALKINFIDKAAVKYEVRGHM